MARTRAEECLLAGPVQRGALEGEPFPLLVDLLSSERLDWNTLMSLPLRIPDLRARFARVLAYFGELAEPDDVELRGRLDELAYLEPLWHRAEFAATVDAPREVLVLLVPRTPADNVDERRVRDWDAWLRALEEHVAQGTLVRVRLRKRAAIEPPPEAKRRDPPPAE